MASQPQTSAEAKLALLASELEPEALDQLVDFAEYLGFKQWAKEQTDFALAHASMMYGEDEPEYTLSGSTS